MNVGIVGLPQSGKTTVFNAATRGSADLTAYAGEAKANVGVARVPDARLDALAGVFGPKRTVAAEIGYVDAPSSGEPSGGLVPPDALDELRGVDALAIVVRAFDDADVAGAGPVRDAEEALLELALTDAGVLERRLTRIAEGSKGLRAAERDALDRERALVLRVKDGLENGAAVADQELTEDESRVLGGFGLMTSKPVVVVLNTGEGPTEEAEAVSDRVRAAVNVRGRVVALCGSLEMELGQMEPAEEAEMREGLGAGEPALEAMARAALGAADMIAFFTGNANEIRSWTVRRGTTTAKAAGGIHSDFERGFIRAEVIGTDDLLECGSTREARSRGLLRSEGKSVRRPGGRRRQRPVQRLRLLIDSPPNCLG